MSGTFLLLVANERPLINVDITLLLNIGVWLLLFFFLRSTFWGPMLRLIAAREEGTEGLRTEAAELRKQATGLRTDFDARHQNALQGAQGERKVLQDEGKRRADEILAKVREEVNASLETQRATLATERAKVRKEVQATVPALAADIAAKILRREVRA